MIDYRLAVLPDDVPLLASWNQQLIEDEGHRNAMDLPKLEERMRNWLRSGEYQAVLFSRGAFVVAYALFRVEEDTVHLRQFFVARDRRRVGVGRSAVRTLVEHILPEDKRITVDSLTANIPALEFWRACGFGDYAVTFSRESMSDRESS